MQAKQMMLGLLTSAVLGGGVAVGGYKLLEPERPLTPSALVIRRTMLLLSATAR